MKVQSVFTGGVISDRQETRSRKQEQRDIIVKMEVHMTEWEMGLEVHFPTSRAQ